MRIATLAILMASMAASAVPASADETCTDKPKSEWLSKEAFLEKVESQGMEQVVEFEEDHGCYEVYGFHAEKGRVEIYYDPVTAEIEEVE